MSKRKRHTVQPMLEPMESRVVPSGISINPHHVQALTAHVGRMHNSVAQAKAGQRANNQALKVLRQQEHLVHVHSPETNPFKDAYR